MSVCLSVSLSLSYVNTVRVHGEGNYRPLETSAGHVDIGALRFSFALRRPPKQPNRGTGSAWVHYVSREGDRREGEREVKSERQRDREGERERKKEREKERERVERERVSGKQKQFIASRTTYDNTTLAITDQHRDRRQKI